MYTHLYDKYLCYKYLNKLLSNQTITTYMLLYYFTLFFS